MYILASDYDGTLNLGGVSPAVRDAIRRFREAGNLFGVVTGRDYYFYDIMMRDRLELDFILAMNGAMVVNTVGENSGEVIHAELCENHGVIRGITELVGNGYGFDVSCVTVKDRVTFHALIPEGNDRFAPLSKADEVPLFTQLNTRCRTEDDARRCTAEINERFGDVVNALQNGICIDIPPKGIDKGEGVARFAASRGVPEANVYCAGDNMNDMAMVARFHGCAVKNAVPALKEAAEGVYDDVAAIIEHIMVQAE